MNSFTHDTHTLLEQRRQQLENTLRHSSAKFVERPSRLQKVLNDLGQTLVRWLTQGDAPRISLSTQGDTEIWRVYDPVNTSTHYFNSENEVRDWLDQRYYG